MKVVERMGLIGAGSVSQSFIARLPSLRARLGPIKGVSFSAARRLAAQLRAGFAVPAYSALEMCPAIWIVAPDSALAGIERDLAAQTPLHKTMVVVCDSERESTSFELLRARGARVATLNATVDVRQATFLAEGHRETLRELRRMLEEDRRPLLELRTGSKAAYTTGLRLVTELLRPWVASAIVHLQAAGIARPEAADMAEALAIRTLRSQVRTGPKGFSGPVEHDLRRALQFAAAHAAESADAKLYAEGLRLALQYFERPRAKERAAGQHG